MAELTVSVRMPKSEFTEAAHRQRQAWQGAIVHLHHHLHHHPSICTIVGTIIHPSIAERRDAEEANSGLPRRLAVASGQRAGCRGGKQRAGEEACSSKRARGHDGREMEFVFELVCQLSY